MSDRTYLVQARAALRPLADPVRARAMQAYLRDQFTFLGIPTPQRRAAIKALPPVEADGRKLLALAALLWREPAREYCHVAIDLLAQHVERLGPRDLPGLAGLALQDAWWDSVDGMAGVVGDVVYAATREGLRTQAVMDRWLRHRSFWIRRIAMLHQLGWRNETDEVRLFGYADALASEPEFFIRKAIGWALRDYARTRPSAVRAYLASRGERLSPLSRREAAKHL